MPDQPHDETTSHFQSQNPIPGPTELLVGVNSTAPPGMQTGRLVQAAPMPAKIGRFEVRSCLGGGAFGWVYRAFDPTLRREVAIKVLRPDRPETPAARARFLSEARAAATIRHPQIVPVFEVGEAEGLPFIVMGLVPGPTLALVLTQRGKPFPPAEAAAIVRSLAFAVQVAHDKGVVHRDLKPSNVLFDTERREFVVTDFGLARLTNPDDLASTLTGMAGTPAYMPPEQARADSPAIGPRSDVYALGVVLFELLTMRLPFTGSSLAEVFTHILTTPPPSVRAILPGIPAGLDAVCRKAMAKAPTDRHTTARELAEALAPFVALPPLRGKPPAQLISRRAILGGAAASVVAIAAPVGYFIWQANQKPIPEPEVKQPDPPIVPKVTPQTPTFNQAAERRAADWVLRARGNVEVVDLANNATLKPTKAEELPKAFRVSLVTIKVSDPITDAAIRENLSELVGPCDINFGSCLRLTDEGLTVLGRIPGIQTLGVGYTPGVTNVSAKTLARHPTLRHLHLSGTGMTVTGIADLVTIPNLESLNLHRHVITDDWLVVIARAPHLVQLYLGYSQGDENGKNSGRITAKGLTALAGLKRLYLLDFDTASIEPTALRSFPASLKLKEIYLRKTSVQDDDLVFLAEQMKLKTLGLQETEVTDKGMNWVVKCAALETLYLEGTKVGDAGLLTLTGCASLKTIYINDKQITPAGITAFNKVRKDCEVKVSPAAKKE